MGAFYRQETPVVMRAMLATEKNPSIISSAIRNLGKYPSPETTKELITYLGSSSYRNELATAAIDAIRGLDDATLIPALQNALVKDAAQFTSWGYGLGLTALAHLARHEEKRESSVRCSRRKGYALATA